MVVYVLDKGGKSLMPTERTAWVAYALKHGEAKVVRREPFTIQLLRDSTDYLQAVTLGVDVGSRHIGLSATTEKKELYSAQVELRDDVTKLLTARREFRRARRGRKHNWYRPARWQNRNNKFGWDRLPPSIRHKGNAHVRAVLFVGKFLPIMRIRLELGKFDIQKLQNPEIQGDEYQQGTLAGWENLKAYAKYRDGYKCRVCGKSKKDGKKLEVHHIIRKADGGTDVPENVVTLCEECHKAHHKGERKLKFRRPPQRKSYWEVVKLCQMMLDKNQHQAKELVYTESEDASGAKFYMLYSEALWYTANFKAALAMADKSVAIEPNNQEANNFRASIYHTYEATKGNPILNPQQPVKTEDKK